MSGNQDEQQQQQQQQEADKVVFKQTLLGVGEVFVYRIPPLKSVGGHRAEDWDLAKPLQTCTMIVERIDNDCMIRLNKQQKKFGSTLGSLESVLFVQCKIQLIPQDEINKKKKKLKKKKRKEKEQQQNKNDDVKSIYDSTEDESIIIPQNMENKKNDNDNDEDDDDCEILAILDIELKHLDYFVESVVDSSRYFVLRIVHPVTKRSAHIGLGFREREDATQFKMALQDYERSIQREHKALLATAMSKQKEQQTTTTTKDAAAATTTTTTTENNDVPQISNLTLKEGETIRINLKGHETSKKTKKKTGGSGGGVPLLLKKPPAATTATTTEDENNNKDDNNNAGKTNNEATPTAEKPPPDAANEPVKTAAVEDLVDDDEWNDFESPFEPDEDDKEED